MNAKKKVFVGLSGGVDSSVSAALLIDAGYDVTGVFIKVWEAPFLPCTWREERRDAQRVAAHLGIPLLTLDLADAYKKSVVDTFVAAYARGETPNPDVLCNKEIKFGAFHDFAMREGADAIATGHYAQRQPSVTSHQVSGIGEEGKTRYTLMRSADTDKDQTYFLWTIEQEVLQKTLFPIGHLRKSEVRAIARKKKLPTAEKKDSQGICFLGDVDMATFLKEFIVVEPGIIEDESGHAIGTHDGAILYTIGERHGLRISSVGTDSRPWFIVKKDVARNVLVVAHRSLSSVSSVDPHSCIEVEDWHMISGKDVQQVLSEAPFSVSVRYRQDPVPVVWDASRPLSLHLSSLMRDVAPGQSAVLYRGNDCLGGGIITRVS